LRLSGVMVGFFTLWIITQETLDRMAVSRVLRPALISSLSPTLFKGKSRGVSRSGLGGARTSV
jgi:hypothetical protein